MTMRERMMVGLLVLAGVPGGMAQAKREPAAPAGGGSGHARYFQITVVLRFSGAGAPEERTQSITTDVATWPDRPGAAKARVISQLPYTTSKGTSYIDVGTKLDCNEVHLDGQALALSVVLDTSNVTGTVTTHPDGRTLEEPVISQRSLAQQIRLPLGVPTVILDSKNVDRTDLKPLPLKNDGAEDAKVTPRSNGGVESLTQVEMTARELP